MGEFGADVPCGKALSELFAEERRTQKMTLEREVLPDRAEARHEGLSPVRLAEAVHSSLTFARRLMAILGPIVHASCGLDEHVFDVRQFGDIGFRCRVAAKLIGDDLARHRARTKHVFEEPFGSSLVPAFLHQDVQFGAMLISSAP